MWLNQIWIVFNRFCFLVIAFYLCAHALHCMKFNGLDAPCRCSPLTELLNRLPKLLHSYGIYQGIDYRIGIK